MSVCLYFLYFSDFQGKNADVSRTQVVCHVIHIFFGSSLGKVYHSPIFIIVGYVSQILGRGVFLLPPPPICEQPLLPILNRVNQSVIWAHVCMLFISTVWLTNHLTVSVCQQSSNLRSRCIIYYI